MKRIAWVFLFGLASALVLEAADEPPQVHTQAGTVEGERSTDGKVVAFKGIPFAKPPVGDLRWRAPEPVAPWDGVRKATEFGARCSQGRIFDDMKFRDNGPSEDCLYLNVWTPNTSAGAHLPVMVWIYGGGFQAGAASEPRQDGSDLTKKGVVVVSMNYRLGIFGFFSHPALTAESPHHASGNYGLLDQTAALAWVQKNIKAFGGDPDNVSIFGESAGSISVSAQMASPRAAGLFKKAIGESGSVFMLRPMGTPTLAESEKEGEQFASEKLHATTLEELRKIPADQLLSTVLADKAFRFWPNVDGWFYPKPPAAIYAAGKQAHVSLLAGWNADEQGYQTFLGHETSPTVESYRAKVKAEYGANADEILKLYPAENDAQVKEAARDLASDRFLAYSTWKWIEMQRKTGGKSPVYCYHFEQAPPQPAGEPSRGAYHSADIEYVFEALDSKALPWTDSDRKLSDILSSYWTNFAKTGDPNGEGLPQWPQYSKNDGYQVMHLGVAKVVATVSGAGTHAAESSPHAAPFTLRPRYELLDSLAEGARP